MMPFRRAFVLARTSRSRLTDFGLGFIKRYLSDDLIYQPAVTDFERARSVTSFYYQVAIDNAAKKVFGET